MKKSNYGMAQSHKETTYVLVGVWVGYRKLITGSLLRTLYGGAVLGRKTQLFWYQAPTQEHRFFWCKLSL